MIRAAGEITNEYEFVVIGSQSVVGALASPSAACVLSMTAEIYPLHAPALADLIDGRLRTLSLFLQHFGYHAQGIGPDTARLPRGWQQRLVALQTQGTNLRIAHGLDPFDLFVAKACAAREKDAVFNRALLDHDAVDLAQALKRAAQLEGAVEASRAQAWIRRLAAQGLM